MKLFAKKSLGQHFLNSAHVLEQIISAAQIQQGEQVLEIGPGTGILTRALLNAGALVIAIEKDERAIAMLEQDFFTDIKEKRLNIITGDVLDEKILSSDSSSPIHEPFISGSFALVANIPYYITGAILEKFLEHGPRPNRMVLLVQKEVAERICARDGKESILSISVKAFGTPKIAAKVPPGAFTPPPTVDSAILVIENISNRAFAEKNLDVKRFFSIVKAGFAHKRKLLARNLESVIPRGEIGVIWDKIGFDKNVRAEDLDIEEWLKI